jgi:hypothetical protein
MNNRTWLYSGLVVVVLILVGVGIWLVTNSSSEPVKIPAGDPVVVMDISFIADGEESQLSIYTGGEIIDWKDTGLTSDPVPGDTATRVWRTGNLDTTQMDALFEFFRTNDFNDLDTLYLAGNVTPPSDTITDRYITISVDSGDINNRVTAYGYFTAGSSDPYSDLPDPLDKIYNELTSLMESNTKEVLTEDVPAD